MHTEAHDQRDPCEAAAAAGRVRWKLAGIELDERTLELRVQGAMAFIEPKPLDLFRFLLRRIGEVVTREEILTEVWPARVVSEAVVTNCVAKLRTALGDTDQSIVRTVPRFGYRLVGDVQCEPVNAALALVTTDLGLHAGQSVPMRPGWLLVKPLGAGGHGEVWLATHSDSREERVFKFCRRPDDLTTIKREITLQRVLLETLGKTDHFVGLLSHNLETEPFFLEMPYFPDGNLADWLQRCGGAAQVSLDKRLELVAQCAEAVAMAHSAGVLHKDLKPSNVLIETDANGALHARLCDFGAGRMLDPDLLTLLGLTRRGFTRTLVESDSTPMYLAPEVMAGQPPTASSDIYSLGVILYQMTIGDLRRPLAPGWESDVKDPMLREDIALAAAGNLRRRLSDAGQLTTRLRSLAARREEREMQRQNAEDAEKVRRVLDVWRARRGLVVVLVSVLVVGAVFMGFHFSRAHGPGAACAPVGATVSLPREWGAVAGVFKEGLHRFDNTVAGGGRRPRAAGGRRPGPAPPPPRPRRRNPPPPAGGGRP
ncbi:MAG: protein kinase domain-containing protein, partial [Panacagrimonas sp.]